MAASPASRVALYEFGHIDIACNRASNIRASKSTHPLIMLYHTHAFCLTYGMGRVYEKREYIFDMKNKGENRSCC